jgi:hypothetical protein
MIKKWLFWSIFGCLMLLGVSANAQMEYGARMQIEINNKIYSVVLENNITADALRQRLPMTLNMEDLNGNEKYTYLTEPLPEMPQPMDLLQMGDVLLWGNDCLVIFYNNASTIYQYTKIGHIENAEDLAITVGRGSVNATWF